MTDEATQRAAVVAEALSWRGTPYHPRARVKGKQGGVDCALFLAEVYQRAGMIARVDPPFYPPDWHLHCREGDERFLGVILSTGAAEFAGPPQPGDVVAFRIGHAFAHAAIVIAPGWPKIIHSDLEARCVTLADATRGRHAVQNDGRMRPVRFFTLWPETLET
jgi:cell wall-associated NlpC family hydrolase